MMTYQRVPFFLETFKTALYQLHKSYKLKWQDGYKIWNYLEKKLAVVILKYDFCIFFEGANPPPIPNMKREQ
jgi:hypothetical protein